MSKKESVHYVNNAQFSQAVVDYVTIVNEAKYNSKEPPKVPDYIAQCFLRIAEGLSHKHNFIRYTYERIFLLYSNHVVCFLTTNLKREKAARYQDEVSDKSFD